MVLNLFAAVPAGYHQEMAWSFYRFVRIHVPSDGFIWLLTRLAITIAVVAAVGTGVFVSGSIVLPLLCVRDSAE